MKLKELIKARDEVKIEELMNADPGVLNEKDENGTSAIVLLAYFGLTELLQKAIQLKTNFDFVEAIVCGRADVVEQNLTDDPSLLNKYSDDGFVPISLAAFFNQDAIVKTLLEKGADPNLQATNASKVNALHSSVARENIAVSRMLIEHGIDVNAVQTQNVTALHSAAHRGNLELVKLLVENGAKTDVKMESGETPLDMAKKDNHDSVVSYLENLK